MLAAWAIGIVWNFPTLRVGAFTLTESDIRLLQSFGYRPKVPLSAGLPKLADWYVEHASEAPDSAFEF